MNKFPSQKTSWNLSPESTHRKRDLGLYSNLANQSIAAFPLYSGLNTQEKDLGLCNTLVIQRIGSSRLYLGFNLSRIDDEE